MSDSKAHAIPSAQNESKLWWAFALTGTYLIAEVIAGLWLNSLALISDAAHMLTDAAALGIALAAVRIAKRPTDLKRTYGYHRFEILAAAFNALLLFAVAIYILYEAWRRFGNPVEVQSVGMLWVAAFGLVINLISMRLLNAGKEQSLNLKGAYLEVWSDMLGSFGVIFAAIAIYFTGWAWVDTVLAVAIGLWVLPRTWVLLKETLNILLEGAPDGVDLAALTRSIQNQPGVLDVHDLHLWAITTGKNSLTAHVVHETSSSAKAIIERINAILANDFDIHHSTLQCELSRCARSLEDAIH